MKTVLKYIYLDPSTYWMFDNPVKVTKEFDYDSPPIGSAFLYMKENGLYADIILEGSAENHLELYPHISFSKNSKAISSIKLSSIENANESVKTIDQQTMDADLPHF
ncbi:hypothetical protein OCK74_21535 [Chitinophagaceae bacterium LB-8]|uniref:Uncharacterized protein n=1 Tax=Paraflavisolibacter caeni TaxID=2982496 RepID=A0A9X2Y1P6_9BACT|nr:hypothetical protein [Paraflavisolibacter caeni]MCU7551718.1 hypothetical protein [Paraflavisolibacter caeni]